MVPYTEILKDHGYMDVVVAMATTGTQLPEAVTDEVVEIEGRAQDFIRKGGQGLVEAWSNVGRIAAMRAFGLMDSK